jgi:hypothetical protein
MSQEPSLRQSGRFVRQALTAYTRSLQAYLGHKNIQHTVRYTELAPKRFMEFPQSVPNLTTASHASFARLSVVGPWFKSSLLP